MSIKSLVFAAAVAAGTLGFADRADAQWWRRGAVYYNYPAYTYSYPTTTYYTSPSVVTDGGVVTASYSTPYYSSYSYPGTSYYYPSTNYYYPSTGYYSSYSPGYSYPGGYVNYGGGRFGRYGWRW